MRLVRPSLAANVHGVVNEVLAKLAANVVLDPARTFVDERDGLQPAIPLVCESKCRRRSLGCDDLHLKTRALDGGGSGHRICFGAGRGAGPSERFNFRRALHGGRTLLEAWASQKNFQPKLAALVDRLISFGICAFLMNWKADSFRRCPRTHSMRDQGQKVCSLSLPHDSRNHRGAAADSYLEHYSTHEHLNGICAHSQRGSDFFVGKTFGQQSEDLRFSW
jgi:hypothetical protein